MGIIGSILGDIAGSRFEFDNTAFGIRKTRNYELFTDKNFITDDTVMSIACMDACLHGLNFEKYYRKYAKKYPDAGYGSNFRKWIYDKHLGPYNSFGNGAAMRCSFVGQYFSAEMVESIAKRSAECTHDHPEGIKGAITLATCVRMAEDGVNKKDILKYGSRMYPRDNYPYSCEIPTFDYADTITYKVSCQDSVPVAIRCFYETDSLTDCLYLVNSMRIDTDTVGAIAGAICGSFYGEDSPENLRIIERYLNTDEYRFLYKRLNKSWLPLYESILARKDA